MNLLIAVVITAAVTTLFLLAYRRWGEKGNK